MEVQCQTRVAVITGGSNGIGLAIALKFAAQGITVLVADLTPPVTVHENIIYRRCDVADGTAVNAFFEWVNTKHKTPDYLMLNAGKGIHEKLSEGDPEKWLDVLNLNVMGVLRCIRAFLPAMQFKKNGHIVFISSVSAAKPYPYGAVYAGSKAAVEAIAETLRLETQPEISVTVVAPGTTKTGFFKGRQDEEAILQDSLLADDIAEDVWYAVNKRTGTSINKIITRPAGQDF
jgi:NADP-dependent 3-hydroxy acid dehydrogenase YdfG